MAPSFHPRLVNGPFEDPGLFVPFAYQKRAFLFDLGDLRFLSGRDLVKISHVFVTHAHMDHFFGFDRLVRSLLGRPKTIRLYGPEGFLSHVEGKLSGYVWNLVENYPEALVVEATEVNSKKLLKRVYRCDRRFQADMHPEEDRFDGTLMTEPALSVSTTILDHQIPCLGFLLRERFHVNIIKEEVERLGLPIGPWLKDFKQALYEKHSQDAVFAACPANERKRSFALGELSDRIARITPGQKIAYISDVIDTPENREKMIILAEGADHLFIEAAFLDKDKEQAARKYHLTARQAGEIAGQARVKNFTLFHFSPRYQGEEMLLMEEALTAHRDTTG